MEKETKHTNLFLNNPNLKTNPFKTPDNYFNQLSGHTMPKQLPKTTGFITPKNYFSNFKVNLAKAKVIKLIPYISVAAAMVISFLVFKSSHQFTDILKEQNAYTSEKNEPLNAELTYSTNIKDVLVNIDELSLEIEDYDLIDF